MGSKNCDGIVNCMGPSWQSSMIMPWNLLMRESSHRRFVCGSLCAERNSRGRRARNVNDWTLKFSLVPLHVPADRILDIVDQPHPLPGGDRRQVEPQLFDHRVLLRLFGQRIRPLDRLEELTLRVIFPLLFLRHCCSLRDPGCGAATVGSRSPVSARARLPFRPAQITREAPKYTRPLGGSPKIVESRPR